MGADAVAEFWDNRPELEPLHRHLLNTFWRLRRETNTDSVIKSIDIEREIERVMIEPDIGLSIIQKIDDEYRNLYANEMRRKRAQK